MTWVYTKGSNHNYVSSTCKLSESGATSAGFLAWHQHAYRGWYAGQSHLHSSPPHPKSQQRQRQQQVGHGAHHESDISLPRGKEPPRVWGGCSFKPVCYTVPLSLPFLPLPASEGPTGLSAPDVTLLASSLELTQGNTSSQMSKPHQPMKRQS